MPASNQPSDGPQPDCPQPDGQGVLLTAFRVSLTDHGLPAARTAPTAIAAGQNFISTSPIFLVGRTVPHARGRLRSLGGNLRGRARRCNGFVTDPLAHSRVHGQALSRTVEQLAQLPDLVV